MFFFFTFIRIYLFTLVVWAFVTTIVWLLYEYRFNSRISRRVLGGPPVFSISKTSVTSIFIYRIGVVMVSVLASSAVDREFEPRSGQNQRLLYWYLLLLRLARIIK